MPRSEAICASPRSLPMEMGCICQVPSAKIFVEQRIEYGLYPLFIPKLADFIRAEVNRQALHTGLTINIKGARLGEILSMVNRGRCGLQMQITSRRTD